MRPLLKLCDGIVSRQRTTGGYGGQSFSPLPGFRPTWVIRSAPVSGKCKEHLFSLWREFLREVVNLEKTALGNGPAEATLLGPALFPHVFTSFYVFYFCSFLTDPVNPFRWRLYN